MTRIAVLAGSVAPDIVRRKVVYVVAFFALVFSVVAPSLPSYGVGVIEAVYREVALAVVFVAALVVTLVLSVGRIPMEIDRRTAYNILAKPVHRWEYVVGTWLGIWFTMGWLVGAFTVIAMIVGAVSYGPVMWVLLQGALGVWLEMGVLAAFALLVSSRLGVATSVLGTLTFLFAVHSRSSLFEPGTLAHSLYPSLDTLNVIVPVAHGHGVTLPYVGTMLLVSGSYVALLLVSAGLAFRGRDL